MDFNALEVLVWLVKDPNLGRTAERLKVSQPTLTKRLAQLEFKIGRKLFLRRGSQGLEPLPAAYELAESAKTLLDNWSYATNLVQMKSGEKPFLSVDGPALFMQLVVAPIWAKSSYHSKYQIQMKSSAVADINLEVSGKELDAAFLFDKSKAMDHKFLTIARERMAIVYNKASLVTPETILNKKDDGLRWVSYRPDRDPLNLLIQSGKLPQKNTVGYFEDLTALLNVIACDARFATVLPYHAVLHRPEFLTGLPLDATEQTLYFVYRPGGEREAIFKSFGELIAEGVQAIPYFLP